MAASAPGQADTESAVVAPGGMVDLELATRLRLAIGRLNRRIKLVSNEIPPLQLATLVTLDCHGPMCSGELARHELVAPPTMTRVLASLFSRGLVNRTANPGDARSVRISLSDKGAMVLAQIRSERVALLGVRLSQLTTEQRDALEMALPALEALVTASE